MSPAPKTTITAPKVTSDVTPEQALSALVAELGKAGVAGLLGKGARNNSMRIAAGQLHTALERVQALEAEAAKLRTEMSGLVQGALDAIAGKAPLKATTAPKVNGGDPASATTAPTV